MYLCMKWVWNCPTPPLFCCEKDVAWMTIKIRGQESTGGVWLHPWCHGQILSAIHTKASPGEITICDNTSLLGWKLPITNHSLGLPLPTGSLVLALIWDGEARDNLLISFHTSGVENTFTEGKAEHLKGRHSPEQWGYFFLSSVLSLQFGSDCGLFPSVPRTGEGKWTYGPTAFQANPSTSTCKPVNGLRSEKIHAWLVWSV